MMRCLSRDSFRYPMPDSATLGLELSISQRSLEPHGVHGSSGDIEIHLCVDVGRASVMQLGTIAEKLRNQAAKHHEFRSRTVVMDDMHQRLLGRSAGIPGTGRVPPTQTPASQTSTCVHASASSQAAPSGAKT